MKKKIFLELEEFDSRRFDNLCKLCNLNKEDFDIYDEIGNKHDPKDVLVAIKNADEIYVDTALYFSYMMWKLSQDYEKLEGKKLFFFRTVKEIKWKEVIMHLFRLHFLGNNELYCIDEDYNFVKVDIEKDLNL